MKDTTRIVLYKKAMDYLQAALQGEVYTFLHELSEGTRATVERVDEYLARKIAYDPQGIISSAFEWNKTREGEDYWRRLDTKWLRYLKQHIEEIDDEVRKVLS